MTQECILWLRAYSSLNFIRLEQFSCVIQAWCSYSGNSGITHYSFISFKNIVKMQQFQHKMVTPSRPYFQLYCIDILIILDCCLIKKIYQNNFLDNLALTNKFLKIKVYNLGPSSIVDQLTSFLKISFDNRGIAVYNLGFLTDKSSL